MRNAMMENGFIEINNELVGVSLGFDYCAEHEWGYQGLAQKFGIGSGKADVGIERRVITKIDPKLSFEIKKKKALLISENGYFEYKSDPEQAQKDYFNEIFAGKNYALPMYSGREFVSGWSEKDFGILVSNKDNIEKLQVIHEAFLNLDIAVGTKPSVWFGAGLVFLIASKIPQEYAEEVLANDISRKKLENAVEATGIKEKLKKAGCGYFALSPRWTNEEKGEFEFWLNPMQQQQNNFGWFKIPDLLAWIEGKGPIPMSSS